MWILCRGVGGLAGALTRLAGLFLSPLDRADSGCAESTVAFSPLRS